MFYDSNDEPAYEFGVDFNSGDKVYADCYGMGQAGILINVRGEDAFVNFGGTYGIMKTSLISVSPYDLT